MRAALYTLAALCTVLAAGAVGARQDETRDQSLAFIRPGTWWGLFFAKDNDPLRRDGERIPMVKVLAVDERHPSWIKVAYPKNGDERIAMAWKAGQKIEDSPGSPPQEVLAELEAEVKDWEVVWVNLHFAVSALEIELPHAFEPAAESVSDGP